MNIDIFIVKSVLLIYPHVTNLKFVEQMTSSTWTNLGLVAFSNELMQKVQSVR